MQAIILAGGKGTRLKPYTTVLPKPLMPIGDFPILEVVIRQLANCGFNKIIIAVNHQAELIKAYFGDGSRWNTSIGYSLEGEPLGTMGPLSLIKNLDDNFLIMNGDILTDLDYANLYDYHVAKKSIFTISSYSRVEKIDYGVLEVVEDLQLRDIYEKPSKKFLVSMGVYIASIKVISHIPKNKNFGFDELMKALINAEIPVNTKEHTGYWLDIGRPDDYIRAIDEFDVMRSKFLNE